MSPTTTLTHPGPTSSAIYSRLSQLKQFVRTAAVLTAHGWKFCAGANILHEIHPGKRVPGAPADQFAYLTVPGVVSDFRLVVSPKGSFNPKFKDPFAKAKYSFVLVRPEDDILGPAYNTGKHNLHQFKASVCNNRSANFFVTVNGEEHLRFTKNIFKKKGENPPEIDNATYPVEVSLKAALLEAIIDHNVRPLAVFDMNDNPVAPLDVPQRVTDSLTGEIAQVVVLWNAPPWAPKLFKRGIPFHHSPSLPSTPPLIAVAPTPIPAALTSHAEELHFVPNFDPTSSPYSSHPFVFAGGQNSAASAMLTPSRLAVAGVPPHPTDTVPVGVERPSTPLVYPPHYYAPTAWGAPHLATGYHAQGNSHAVPTGSAADFVGNTTVHSFFGPGAFSPSSFASSVAGSGTMSALLNSPTAHNTFDPSPLGMGGDRKATDVHCDGRGDTPESASALPTSATDSHSISQPIDLHVLYDRHRNRVRLLAQTTNATDTDSIAVSVSGAPGAAGNIRSHDVNTRANGSTAVGTAGEILHTAEPTPESGDVAGSSTVTKAAKRKAPGEESAAKCTLWGSHTRVYAPANATEQGRHKIIRRYALARTTTSESSLTSATYRQMRQHRPESTELFA
ncbi:hypothetical protein C8J57DRAFT_1214106 [Mycena rebaudengoi]|nr:hypothetical protein C8J57DRAFT_1214106 [Mycena rebaudengoi]